MQRNNGLYMFRTLNKVRKIQRLCFRLDLHISTIGI